MIWTTHPRVLDIADVKWARRALWAPSIVQKGGWSYLFFGANDIQSDAEVGGIGVARARDPEGPFKDYLGTPLIDKFHWSEGGWTGPDYAVAYAIADTPFGPSSASGRS